MESGIFVDEGMEKVYLVILNYKLADKVIKCVQGVKLSSYKNYQILVVDNNSQDGIEKKIEGLGIEFLQSGQNLGYSGGNNLGIKKALERGADYIFILNPDTEVRPDTIEKLLDGLKLYGAGIGGPKIYFDKKEKRILYAGGIFDQENVIGRHRGVDEEDSGQYDIAEETDFVTGAAMMIKREVIEKIGMLDERFFLYYEDTDYCKRAKDAGFKVMYIPQALVYHENSQSTGLGSSLQDYYLTRNRMLIASKYLSFRARFALFREALRNWENVDRRQALIDFMLGKYGRRAD